MKQLIIICTLFISHLFYAQNNSISLENKTEYLQLIELDSISFRDIGYNFMCFRSKINFYIVLTKTTKVTPDFVSEPLVLGRKYSLKNLKVADDNYEFFSKINTTFKRIGGMYDSIDTGRTRSNTCEFRTILTKNKYNVSHVGFGYNYYVSDSIYNCSIARSIQSKYAINYTGWKIRFIGKHSKVFFVRW